MIHAVTLPVDELIQVSNFRSEFGVRTTFVAEPNERSILVKPTVGSPICIVQIKKDLIPHDERVFWTVR